MGDQVLINNAPYTVAGIAGNLITLMSGSETVTFERVPLTTGGNHVTADERNEILSYVSSLTGTDEEKIAMVMNHFGINRYRAMSAVATITRRQRAPYQK